MGSNIDIEIITILGLANSFGDAISMAFGDYLGSKAQAEFRENERKREKWEI